MTATCLIWESVALSPGPALVRSPASREPRHEQEDFNFVDLYSNAPIANGFFDLIEPTGGGWGHAYYLQVHGQLAPRTFSMKFRSHNRWRAEKFTKAGLLEKDRHALLRMTANSNHPMSMAEVEHYLRISALTHVDQTLYANFVGLPDNGREREIIAMLKLVRGHRYSENYQSAQLPWMHDFKVLAKTVDRSKEQFIYEFARGSNDGDPELFRFCFATLVKEAAADTLTRGGRLDDAFIYIHTVRPSTERHFTRNFPWKVWARPADGHTILKVSIADAINDKQFRPWEYSDILHDQIRLMAPARPSDVMTFMHDVTGRSEKNFELADARGVIAARVELRDDSRLTEARARLIARDFGIEWRKVEIAARVGGLNRMIYGRESDEPPDGRDRGRLELESLRSNLTLEEIDYQPVLDHYRSEFRELKVQTEARGLRLQDLGLPEGFSEDTLLAGLELGVATRLHSKPPIQITTSKKQIESSARERLTKLKSPLLKLREASKVPRRRWVW